MFKIKFIFLILFFNELFVNWFGFEEETLLTILTWGFDLKICLGVCSIGIEIILFGFGTVIFLYLIHSF